MEEVTKCRYIDCVDTREKEQILHELPVCDTGLCVRWLINSGHVDLIGRDLDALRSMKFFVCNNHFTEDCYLSKGTLKENAVPFPHWSAVSRRLKSLKTRRKIQANGQESSMEEVSINEAAAERNSAPSVFDVDQWCRTCATKKQNLVSMTSKGKGTDMSLLSKLKLLIEIDDEDALPTKMCDECVDKLEQSFKFFQQIYVADNTLRHVFPNSRANSMPKKPLYSLSEHMRREQREKEKEMEMEMDREKEKEKEKEKGKEEERAPRVTRGTFRRGRGRPRSRGLGGRGRGRQRSAQVALSVQSPSAGNVSAIVKPQVEQSRRNEAANVRNNESEIESREDERQGDTVFSLLTDTCRSDEELDWSDVLKVMNVHQRYTSVEGDDKLAKKPEPRLEEKAEVEAEAKVETKIERKAEVAESSEVETASKMDAEWSEVSMEEQRNIKVDSGGGDEIREAEVVDKRKPRTEGKEGGRIRCKFCEKEFKFRLQLRTHLLADHSELSRHMCTDCLACYENESLLAKHRGSLHGAKMYRCEHCQLEFPDKRVLKEHIRKCQPCDSTRYSCDICGVTTTFHSKEDLFEHVKNHRDNLIASRGSELEAELFKGVDNETVSSPKPVRVDTEGTGECKESAVEEKESTVTTATSVIDTSSNAMVRFESTSDERNLDHDLDRVPTSVPTCVPVPAPDPEAAPATTRFEDNASEEIQVDDGQSIACPDCKEQMQNTLELKIHRMRRHSVNRKDAACLLCDNKSFCSSEEYEQHVLDHCKRLRISPR